MRLLGVAMLLAAAIGGAEADPTAGTPLGEGVLLVPGGFEPGQQPDGNSVLFRGSSGWVVVDSGRHPAHATRILDAVAVSGLPIAAVVNTHWHLDHVSGNPQLRAAYPELVVHASDAIDDALGGFLAHYRAQLEGLLARPGAGTPAERSAWTAEIARIAQGRALRPDVVVSAPMSLEAGGRRLQLRITQDAATAADVWVLDPASGVLAVGDLVTLPAPFFDTACPERWLAALDVLAAVPFRTLVPGHGAPMDGDALRRYRDGFRALLDCAAGGDDAGSCASGWIAAMGPLLPAAQHVQARELIEYYVPERLRGPGATSECPQSRGASAR